MHVTPFNVPGVLGPRELSVAAAAYQLALADISDGSGPWAALPAHAVRRRLAGAILAEAGRGDLDPETLKHAALETLARVE